MAEKIGMLKKGDIVTIDNDGRSVGKSGHYLVVGSEATVYSIMGNMDNVWVHGVSVFQGEKILQIVNLASVTLKQTKQVDMSTVSTQKKLLVLQTAQELLKANNTITTLEIKTELRTKYPDFYWTQDIVSATMAEFATQGTFVFTDNGTNRIYSHPTKKKMATVKTPLAKAIKTAAPAPTKAVVKVAKPNVKKTIPATVPATVPAIKATKISRTKASDLLKNSKGHFFTATFVKQDGTERTINAQYVKDQTQSPLGYVLVKESGKLKTNPKDAIRQINLQTLKALRIGGVNYRF